MQKKLKQFGPDMKDIWAFYSIFSQYPCPFYPCCYNQFKYRRSPSGMCTRMHAYIYRHVPFAVITTKANPVCTSWLILITLHPALTVLSKRIIAVIIASKRTQRLSSHNLSVWNKLKMIFNNGPDKQRKADQRISLHLTGCNKRDYQMFFF